MYYIHNIKYLYNLWNILLIVPIILTDINHLSLNYSLIYHIFK